jgi:hypothetical protein
MHAVQLMSTAGVRFYIFFQIIYILYIVIMALNIHITVISHAFCNGSFRIFSLSKTTIFNEDENLPVATNTRHWYIY